MYKIFFVLLSLCFSCGEKSQKIVDHMYCEQIKELFYQESMPHEQLPSQWNDYELSSFENYCQNYLIKVIKSE